MCGTYDPTTPTSVTNDTADANVHNMTCTGRLLALPVFASVSTALCNAYAITKNSHESVAAILGSAENGMRAGLEFASPVTGKIANVLETPFKAIDNAVCVGLDFVEEKMPSVKLPPDQIYASMKDGLRWWPIQLSSDKASIHGGDFLRKDAPCISRTVCPFKYFLLTGKYSFINITSL